jgi:phi LC3 family holin
MKINWKVRFKNKTFLVTFVIFIVASIYTVLGMFDVVPTISEDEVTNYVLLFIEFLGALGIIVDPTTDGVTDSDRALTYGTENDVRYISIDMVTDGVDNIG